MNIKNGLGMLELLIILFLISACLLPIFHQLMSTGALLREATLKEAASTINTSYLETYESQPYQRLKLLVGELDLTVPANYRSHLRSKLKITEIVPDRLISLVVSTSFAESERNPLTLATMVANHHPVTGALK
ncbi:MAG: hypothetical protein KKB51_05140 [Candidatus Riflebacteria bacterium]|nr:hypothetical protein [Candidatus Riflebacteria bacterium]